MLTYVLSYLNNYNKSTRIILQYDIVRKYNKYVEQEQLFESNTMYNIPVTTILQCTTKNHEKLF